MTPKTPVVPAPNLVCPVCGGPNGCQPALRGSFDTPCWCAELTMPPPSPDAPNASCLCRRCATRAGSVEDPLSSGRSSPGAG